MDKKEQIIVAAMKLFAEKGVQASPMSAIARAANTGMGTIYNYFATKEELINAIYLYIKRSEIHLVEKTMDNSLSLKGRFFLFYRSFVHFYLKHPESFAFMDQFHTSPMITAATRQAGQEGFQSVIELIRQGQVDGIIKNMDMEALLQFLGGTITTFVRWIIGIAEHDRPAHMEQQFRLVWDAIKE